jgi:long-chain fatty acid transport protein
MVPERVSLLILCVLLTCCASIRGEGVYVPPAGPVNQSMGRAGTAAPLEAIGTLSLNPAAISALPDSELSFGLGLALPVLETSSSIPNLGAGSTDAEPGVIPLPSVGWVHKLDDSPVTFGLGLFSVAGFATNFPSSSTNPIFTPQSNTPGTPGGFGRVFTKAAFLQLTPTFAYALTDRLSIGGGPTLTLGELIVDPLAVAAPDDADGSGAPRYPSGRGTRVHWGGGAQLGVYYETENCWHWGASVKSPQWMEDFRYRTEDEAGLPRVETFDADLPLVVSVGMAYSGLERVVAAVDVRYYDYDNADGFRDRGFRPDGSVAGLGWESIFVAAAGLQFEVHDRMYVRCGYTFNENPIPDSQTFFNVATPLYYQHQGHLGGSWALADRVWINLAYTYVFQADLTGPIVTPAGAIPGSSVTSTETGHILSLGATVRY